MSETYKRRLKDRKEGRYLRSLDPLNRMTPFIMRHRNDANILFRDSVEISEPESFLRKKRRDGYKGMGMLHIIVASYIRTIACYPALNRFVSGQRIYARNTIEFVMIVKKGMSIEEGETSIKVAFRPDATIFDVYRKLSDAIAEVKGEDSSSGTDKAAAAFMSLPRFFLRFVIGVVKLLDYHGWLPRALLDVSPFHGSMIITDLGSLGIPPVFHHLYNLGNLPVFLAFGAKYKKMELTSEGRIAERKYIDYTADCDERICDGYYMAQCFKTMRHYMLHPSLLEVPPEAVKDDVG